jgi:hypothetical protein
MFSSYLFSFKTNSAANAIPATRAPACLQIAPVRRNLLREVLTPQVTLTDVAAGNWYVKTPAITNADRSSPAF